MLADEAKAFALKQPLNENIEDDVSSFEEQIPKEKEDLSINEMEGMGNNITGKYLKN